jgi:hypothetical protein
LTIRTLLFSEGKLYKKTRDVSSDVLVQLIPDQPKPSQRYQISLTGTKKLAVVNGKPRKLKTIVALPAVWLLPVALFLPEKDTNRHTGKIEILPDLVFEIVAVGRFNIVRMISEKSERRYPCW